MVTGALDLLATVDIDPPPEGATTGEILHWEHSVAFPALHALGFIGLRSWSDAREPALRYVAGSREQREGGQGAMETFVYRVEARAP